MSFWRPENKEAEQKQAQEEQAQTPVYTDEGYRMVEDTETSSQINKDLAQALLDWIEANKK